MKETEFLNILRLRLRGLPPGEVEDHINDYAAHFAEGTAAGRSEDEIAAALGDPQRLARELRAEAGFRRWETHRTPSNFAAAIAGFIALIAVDFIFILPLLIALMMFTMISGIVAAGLCIGGLGVLIGQVGPGFFSLNTVEEMLTGIALLGFGIGGGALLAWMTDAVLRLLVKYARVHYTILNQGGIATS